MILGIDLRALQSGHKYRGIGEVIRRTLDELFMIANRGNLPLTFLCFSYDDAESVLRELNVPEGIQLNEVRIPRVQPIRRRRHPLKWLIQCWAKYRLLTYPSCRECDVFLQFDYALGIPRHTKCVLIHYDIIPYLYNTAYYDPLPCTEFARFKLKVKHALDRWLFKSKVQTAIQRADRVLAISKHSAEDLVEHFGSPRSKLGVIRLGVSEPPNLSRIVLDELARVPSGAYLLFIGGMDPERRPLHELIEAFNELRSRGCELQLVLAGKQFCEQDGLWPAPFRRAFEGSPYQKDIHLLGYISDARKAALFEKALAFVFPSRYEGFGLPILEAMLHRCPVIAYRNSSIPEVGGRFIDYADGPDQLVEHVLALTQGAPDQIKQKLNEAQCYAQQFSWKDTGRKLMDELLVLAEGDSSPR